MLRKSYFLPFLGGASMLLLAGCQPGEQVMRGTGEGARKDSSFIRIVNFSPEDASLKLGQGNLGGRVAPGEVMMPVPTAYGQRSLRLFQGAAGKERETPVPFEYKSGEIHSIVILPDRSFVVTQGEPRKVANDVQLVVRVVGANEPSATLTAPLTLSSETGKVDITKSVDRAELRGAVQVSGKGVKPVSDALDPEWVTTLFVLAGATPKVAFGKNGVTIEPTPQQAQAGG
jgi:hypothetical protein